MAESPNRKACDRCHTQKLSCKRIGDEPCQRCIRLKTDCKSSPSLRYRKQQSTADASQEGARSPKRLRTGSENQLVRPSFGLVKIQTIGGYGLNGAAVVSPDPMLDMVDFNFGFDHSSLFTPNSIDQHLSHQIIPERVEELVPRDAIAGTWSPHLSASSDACPDSAFISPTAPDTDPGGRAISHSAFQKQLITQSHGRYGPAASERRSRPRGKQKARQIMLKPAVGRRPASTNQWMPQLSEINARLFELSSSLPQQLESGEEAGHGYYGRPTTPEESRLGNQAFPIDELFKLSKRFAEIIEDITPADGATPTSDNGTQQQQPKALNKFADPGTSLFILSAYVRLLDMYQKVFSCIHSEIAQLDIGNALRYWKLPDVTVGSFAVESTPSLQMSLTIQLAEEFLSQLRSCTAALDPGLKQESSPASRASDGSSMFSGVIDVSFQAIKSREENIGRQLADLRSDIDAFLDS